MDVGFVPVGSNPAPPASSMKASAQRRGKPAEGLTQRFKVENVFGLTVGSNAALDCNPTTQLIAYPAGCTVVLYNARLNVQSHVLNASRKSITCLALSRDGRYLATGECGHAPSVRVWDLQELHASGAVQVAELAGHTHGIRFVVFSTSSKYLVSLGSQHDMKINVWDWKSNLNLATNKVSTRVRSVSFSENSNYFVTVGFRHVKYWYMDFTKKYVEPVPLLGRPAILGELKNNDFCDVICGRDKYADSTFAITRSGILCQFDSRRLLDKWTNLNTSVASCMAYGNNYIFAGGPEGIVRVFSAKSLEYVITMPRPHYLGIDVSRYHRIHEVMSSMPANACFPDVVALAYDEKNLTLTCVYNDHSLYVWDVANVKKVTKIHSALYHSACIWGVDMVCAEGCLPSASFVTCSSDETIRFWYYNKYNKNLFSKELTKLLYIDKELKYLKNIDLAAGNEKEKLKSYDDKTGVRCVRLSPDGSHVASGDRAGNIRIHNARTGALIRTLQAHDAEVLCLEYSEEPQLLASASRDRLIHIFQVVDDYNILQTLDDHSSSITAVRFISSASGLQMVSCGADKTILFRQMHTEQDGSYYFSRSVNVSGRNTLYDMEVDAGGRHILTACQDRNVRVYNTSQGKHTKTFRGTVAEDGTLIKVALDSSGTYLATSSTDKILSVYDYYSGECMGTMYGHSEIVTGLRFTPDCQYLISASGDGCIFVWRVPFDMIVTMKARLAQQQRNEVSASNTCLSSVQDSECESHRSSTPCDRSPPRANSPPRAKSPPRDTSPLRDISPYFNPPPFPFKLNKLPRWARKHLGEALSESVEDKPAPPQPSPPIRNRWAERRALAGPFVSIEMNPNPEEVSKESSLESATDGKAEHTTKEDQESNEHDGDVEDITDSDKAYPPSEHGSASTYYPANREEDNASKFKVNSIDVVDLCKTQRRSKRWRSNIPEIKLISATQTSIDGSGEDTDEDEIPTAPVEVVHVNSAAQSGEPLDQAGRREKYLQSVYDSLSTADADDTTNVGNTSISSQHLSRKQSSPGIVPTDPIEASRREELCRRIRHTRRQLESIGVQSALKESQSTIDLTSPDGPSAVSTYRAMGMYTKPEDTLDSLNYYDSLNVPSDIRNKNPYAIPANNHKYIPDFIATRAILQQINSKNELQNQVPSKVFQRLFPKTSTKDTPKVLSRNFNLNVNKNTDIKPLPKMANPSARSILKNYKSCPVSPVSEECKWADKVIQNPNKYDHCSMEAKKRNSVASYASIDANSVLPDRGKSIMDIIKSDTEKMIAEITEKYGDLDEYELDEYYVPKDDGNFSSDSLEDCSLSQDASCKNKLYSKKVCRKHNINRSVQPRRAISNYEIYGDSICKPTLPIKPSYIASSKSFTLPRNMPSTLDEGMNDASTMGVDYSMYRCQSVLTKRCITTSNESILSDNSNCSSVSNEIFLRYGNEGSFQQAKLCDESYNVNTNYTSDNMDEPDDEYFERHRHSSASFFLNQKKYMKSGRSQESVLSDEMFLDEHQLSRTNCNSLESVLSNESECTKSAPLEMLFEGIRPNRQHMQQRQSVAIPRTSKSCYEFDHTSKSYGSSPNNPSMMGVYVYNNYMGDSLSPNYRDAESNAHKTKPPVAKVYGFDIPTSEPLSHKTVTRSHSLYDSSSKQAQSTAKNVAYYIDGYNIQQYTKDMKNENQIDKHYQQKTRRVPSKPTADEAPETAGMTMVKSKSCSFEVVLESATKSVQIKNPEEKRSSHVQRNLEKFEEQIRKNAQIKLHKTSINKENTNRNKHSDATKSLERGSGCKNHNNKVNMEFVPHKPPKPIKRTSSVKLNNRLKAVLDKSSMSTAISSQYKAKLDGLQRNYPSRQKHNNNSNKLDKNIAHNEKTFDVFIKEKDFNENKSEIQMDSLEIDRMMHISMDSLDLLENNTVYYNEQDNVKNVERFHFHERKVNNFNETYNTNKSKENIKPIIKEENLQKYKCIERKIKIIKKIVEMEERKMFKEKMLKEWRTRPLKENNNNGKGVVKVLSQKFETLAKKQSCNFASIALREAVTRAKRNDTRGIRRNLSLPDILDSYQIGGLITMDDDVECETPPIENTTKINTLNNSITRDTRVLPIKLKQRVYNKTIIPKSDIHIDSENYESSTTSSSCTDSPKRLSILERNSQFRKATARLCMEHKTSMQKSVRSPSASGLGANCLMARVPSVNPVWASAPITVNRHISSYKSEEENGRMRRALSLSDLAVKPTPAPRATVAAKASEAHASKASSHRAQSRYLPINSNLQRATSSGALNKESDSENESQPTRRKAGRLMRPTISSMNKVAPTRRRGVSPSSTAGNQAKAVDSASDAEDYPRLRKARTAASARLKIDKKGFFGNARDPSPKRQEVTTRPVELFAFEGQLDEGLISPSGSMSSTEQALYCALADDLKRVAKRVVLLYETLQEPNMLAENMQLINALEASILDTQNVLNSVVPRHSDKRVKAATNDGAMYSLSSADGDCNRNVFPREPSASGNPAMSSAEQHADTRNKHCQ